jgi:hypothetical protein
MDNVVDVFDDCGRGKEEKRRPSGRKAMELLS